jgi:DNA repair protein RadD
VTTFQPRYYQRDAIDSVYRYFAEVRDKPGIHNPLLAMPTGTGKGVVIALFLYEIFRQWPQQRVMILTHVRELIQQNVEKTLDVWPTAPIGVFSAGLNQKQTINPIIFGGAQSVVNCIELFGHRDLLIIDEAHLVNPDVETRYQLIVAGLKLINPYLKVIGLSAVWYRLGQGLLTQGGGLFTDLCYNICDTAGFTRLITEGFLSPPIPKQTSTVLDTSNVGMGSNGEYNLTQLQANVDKADVNAAALKEMCQHGSNRKSWLIFCSGIEHSEHIAGMLNSYGVSCAAVHSKIKSGERDDRIKAFKSGELRAVTNNNVLTTGFDYADIDFIGMLRPTMSPGLWVQMIGRGTRPAPGKSNCLVLDFARNTQRLGPIDDPVIPRPPGLGGGGDAPVKVCDACGCYNHTRAAYCVACGAEFTFEQKIFRQADTREILSTGMPQVERYVVDRLVYARHVAKKSGLTNIKISYYCGLKMYQEFVSFDQKGYALHRAHEWWRQRSADLVPLSTDLALGQLHKLRTPSAIKVWVNKEHPEIMGYEY